MSGRRWWVVLMLVAGAAIAASVPYRPRRVVGPRVDAGLTPVRRVPGLKLHVFNTGMNRMSSLLVGPTRPWRPAPAFVIEHPREGLVAFDCGLSDQVALRGEAALDAPMRWLFESRGLPERTLAAQMKEAGLEPARVRTVVLSHLHADHVGGAASFSNARFFAGPGASPGAEGVSWRVLTAADFTAPLAPFGRTFDLFGDGSVLLFAGGGHAREDLLALVALPEGPALLAGDAVVHRQWLASDDVERVVLDAPRAAEVRNQVRSVARELLLFPGHELTGIPEREDLIAHHREWFDAAAWAVTP